MLTKDREGEEKKVCVRKKTQGKLEVSILPVEEGKGQMISHLCCIKARQLNALCSSYVALAVCGHMGCERG